MVLGMTQLLDPSSGAGAGAPQPGPSVLDGLAAAAAGLADAWQSPVWPLGSEQLTDALDQMVELHRQAEAVYLRLLGEVDSRGIPLIEGASNTKSWLRERHRSPPGRPRPMWPPPRRPSRSAVIWSAWVRRWPPKASASPSPRLASPAPALPYCA